MSWEQLQTITRSAKQDTKDLASEPPISCPFDGSRLDVNAKGDRNCPMGNYRWPRDGKF